MDAPLHRLIYVSAARKAFSDDQLKALLVKARANNTARGLSGLLLYEGGSFLQVLEGTKPAVNALYDLLGKDARHHRLVRVYESSIEARGFGGWSMGFASVGYGAAKDLAGYSDFFVRHQTTNAAPNADIAQRILTAFRDGRWHAYVEA
jgi:Sensors of blue-light using FAD